MIAAIADEHPRQEAAPQPRFAARQSLIRKTKGVRLTEHVVTETVIAGTDKGTSQEIDVTHGGFPSLRLPRDTAGLCRPYEAGLGSTGMGLSAL
jgi:hypothetical protein